MQEDVANTVEQEQSQQQSVDIRSTSTLSGWSSNFSSSVNVGLIPSAIYNAFTYKTFQVSATKYMHLHAYMHEHSAHCLLQHTRSLSIGLCLTNICHVPPKSS